MITQPNNAATPQTDARYGERANTRSGRTRSVICTIMLNGWSVNWPHPNSNGACPPCAWQWRLKTPEGLHARCLRYMTEAQIAHLFGERMTEIVHARTAIDSAMQGGEKL